MENSSLRNSIKIWQRCGVTYIGIYLAADYSYYGVVHFACVPTNCAWQLITILTFDKDDIVRDLTKYEAVKYRHLINFLEARFK